MLYISTAYQCKKTSSVKCVSVGAAVSATVYYGWLVSKAIQSSS